MAKGRIGGADAHRQTASGVFRREGEYWTLSYKGRTVRMKDAKGLCYIASLLHADASEIHALDLAGSENLGRTPASARLAAYGRHVENGLNQPVLDASSRAAYKARVRDLDDEIEDAECRGDTIALEHTRAERDAIVAALSAAYGLGGRARTLPGDTAERARKAVTERIRTTLARIEKVHPELGRHLRRSVRTGTYCSYVPEAPVEWALVANDAASVTDRTRRLNVMIIDDHPLWRDTLRKVLEHAGIATVVAEASDGTQALELVQQARPDVILLDMGLPDMHGSDVTRALVRDLPDVQVLVLSSSDERHQVVDAVSAGASGYVLKTADGSAIIDAVRRVAAGEAVFPAPVSRIVLAELRAARDQTDAPTS